MLSLFDRHRGLRLASAITALVAMTTAPVLPAFAQAATPPPQGEEEPAALSQPQIERLVAPIALYPDKLLTHVLMASTYPLDIVQAARWRESHPDLKGEALDDALQGETWDSSIKAVTAVPDVLRMMNEKLDWTQQLGEAFLAQEQDVFAAVQALRGRATTAGTLKTTKEIRVERVVAEDGSAYETIEPVVENEYYVPVYDPTVVYGAWPYPDYPPYYWYPPHYHHHKEAGIWFGAAVLVGVALWATWNWKKKSLYINGPKFNAFNKTKFANPNWKFNPAHHKGAPFKLQTLNKKFGPGGGLQPHKGPIKPLVHKGPAKPFINPQPLKQPLNKTLPQKPLIHPTHTPKVNPLKNMPHHTVKPVVKPAPFVKKPVVHVRPQPHVNVHKNMPVHRAAPRPAPRPVIKHAPVIQKKH